MLAAILLAGFGLRLWGCFGQGLPYTFYKDEENNVRRALRFGAERTLDPGWFNKPALGYYILFAEYGAYYAVGSLAGKFGDPSDFAVQYFNDPGAFYLIGRINATVFGTLGLLLAYHLGKRMRDRRLGLLAALVLAVTYGQVSSCQEVKKDVVAAFFTAWSTLLLVDVLEKGRWRDYLLSGLLAGLGMATKYYALILAVPLFYAHVFRLPAARARAPRVWLAPRAWGWGLTFFGGFFLGSPYNFLSRQFLDENVLPQIRFVGQRLGVLGQGLDAPQRGLVDPEASTLWESVDYLLETLFSSRGLGPLLGALFVLGLAFCFLRARNGVPSGVRTASQEGSGPHRRDGLLVLTVLTSAVFQVVANRQFPEPRHLNILYPVAAVLAGRGFLDVWEAVWGRWRWASGLRAGALPALLLLVALPLPDFPLHRIVTGNMAHLRPDPRVRVVSWLNQNLPPDAVVINDKDWVPLRSSPARCEWVMRRIDELRKPLSRNLSRLQQRSREEVSAEDLRWLSRELASLDTYQTQWEFEKMAVLVYLGPVHDVLSWNHDWYAEELGKRDEAAAGYNPLWPRSPWGDLLEAVLKEARKTGQKIGGSEARGRFLERLQSGLESEVREELRGKGIAEVELPLRLAEELERRRELLGIRDGEVDLVALWRHPTPVSRSWLIEGPQGPMTPSFFVSAKITFDNYRTPHKRENFPDWAEFYDDLLQGYDCWEFRSDGGDPHKLIRIWDLRERKVRPRVVVVW